MRPASITDEIGGKSLERAAGRRTAFSPRNVISDHADTRMIYTERVVEPLVACPEAHALPFGQGDVEAVIDALAMSVCNLKRMPNEWSRCVQNERKLQQALNARPRLGFRQTSTAHCPQKGTPDL